VRDHTGTPIVDQASWRLSLFGTGLKGAPAATSPRAWARWTFGWTPPGAGSYTLEARATDSAGNVQPTTSPFNDGGYLFGAVVRHLVTAV
jgi:hypothetical protein